MKKIEISELAYVLKGLKENNQPQPIFFLGAGASKSGKIPLAEEIAEEIQARHSENPRIQKLPPAQKSYTNLMDCLSPFERNSLLRGYIENSKINVTHIYLAQLIKKGFADYVLTVNFDNLMLRALALFNEHPPTYDLAILNDLTTTTFKQKSVIYLHGQHHGLWLLNTESEMDKVNKTVLRVFDSIKNERPWIFIGYSGSDPIFEHIKNLGRFDNGLYWVGFENNRLGFKVQEFIKDQNVNASYIQGYDSDAFMLKLTEELGLGQPDILDRPFTSLKVMLENIIDIDDKDHFKGVKERLEIAKDNVRNAIRQYEKHELLQPNPNKLKVDALKMEIIDLLTSGKFETIEKSYIAKRVSKENDAETNVLFSNLLFKWGNELGMLAEIKWKAELKKEAEPLYQEAIEKYRTLIEINPRHHEVFNNWGNTLFGLARLQQGAKANNLYNEAIKKYKKAISTEPKSADALYNYGQVLIDLSANKQGDEAETLQKQAADNFERAIELKPLFANAFTAWGSALTLLASEKEGTQADALYKQSIEKHIKATEIDPESGYPFWSLGITLLYFAETKTGIEAENLYTVAIKNLKKTIAIKPNVGEVFIDWGSAILGLSLLKRGEEADILIKNAREKYKKGFEITPNSSRAHFQCGNALTNFARKKQGAESESLYQQAIDNYDNAIKIKPDLSTFLAWGHTLCSIAELKQEAESESLYWEAIKKYKKAIEINPEHYAAFRNWGNALGHIAKPKSGKEAENLFKIAFEKINHAIKLGDGHYNLACIHILKNDKANALKYLALSLSNNEITTETVLNDKDWTRLQHDDDFNKIISNFTSPLNRH